MTGLNKYLLNDLALESAKVKCIEDFEVQHALAGVCKTSIGDDSVLPYWLFKHCSYALAPIVSHIFNLSFSTGRPLKAWNHAIISPVVKVSPPKKYLRPSTYICHSHIIQVERKICGKTLSTPCVA